MFKKFLSGALAFTLLFTMPTVPALAKETEVPQDVGGVVVETEQADATEYTSGSYTYVLKEDGTAKITKYTDSTETTITIPNTLDGYTVSEIGKYIFAGCTVLKDIKMPESLKTLGADAFYNCTALETVYYVGSEANWEDIAIVNSGNSALTNATIYYMANLRLFVERMYTVALGRDADSAGLNNWVQMLVEETHDGAGLAKKFILGEEFALRNLSNEEYVDVLYATFFDREADAEGKNLWVAVLEAGQSRAYVLSNFVNLGEFTQLCAEYEINRGVMFEDGEVATNGMIQFVQRLYTLVLGRDADDEGLKSWITALHTKTLGAQNVAAKFFNSTEYELKSVDNSAYVTDLYGVFMNREADADGLEFWVACIEEHGMNRNWVLSEFAKSEEFKLLAAGYGLE